MQFADYLSSKGLSLNVAAAQLRLNVSALSRAVTKNRGGKGRFPSFLLVVRVHIWTGGLVSLVDWIEHYRGELKRAGVRFPKPAVTKQKGARHGKGG